MLQNLKIGEKNASKTVVIIFTKNRIKAQDYPNRLLVGNKPVEFSNSVKYLGITFDSKLLWTEHFNSQLKKCKQYLFTLKKSVYKAWGPKPVYIRWIYIAIVGPKLCYGAIAWGHTMRLETRKEALCLLYTSPSPRDRQKSRMPSSA